ncbi:MAG: type II secretion system F family protein [Mycobacteriaceae bacterium]|nr:type II secretion system F family protein [Mycobacteriaceae bacterium]
MNTVAVLALSLAITLFSTSPLRRLTFRSEAAATTWRVPRKQTRWMKGMVGCLAGGATALLPLPIVLTTAMLGATANLRYRRRRRHRSGIAESRTLETALDVLVGELQVGAHPVHAFCTAADEAGEPVGTSFHAVAARARLGADVSTGLRTVAASSAHPAQWHRLAVCWQLASDHGLAMATLMRAAQRDIVERQRFSGRVAAATAGARATATILAGLPLLGILLGQLIGANPLRFLLNEHTGGWLLLVGVTLACGGLLWCDRITDRLMT